ncbi:alpha-(1,3)-fucosyltransferase 10-like [Haliotis rufescens]|uniref:alpha-(1,3)-fucosyltransferase 10-like n=1 Tax=Haliotis rufescens TaxID=6454 RepID=UPI00201E8B31|nr:alpha-(1,3)-fucosyltransferase 10-like [Haliotis rufescens]
MTVTCETWSDRRTDPPTHPPFHRANLPTHPPPHPTHLPIHRRRGWSELCLHFHCAGQDVSYEVVESHATLPVLTWWESIGKYPDYVISCETQQRCLVSRNKTRLQHQEVMMYVFYGSFFLSSGLPFPRKDGDIWALIHEESPMNKDWLFSFRSTIELFNYTSTFKRGSDYPLTTHWLTNKETLLSKEYLVPTDRKDVMRTDGGLAPIIFVHSDCNTPSNREQYVKTKIHAVWNEEQSTLQLLNCNHSLSVAYRFKNLDGIAGFLKPDFLRLVARYKFAIAFENAICDDYITEKLWRPLQVGTVPIVLGSPTIRDILPSTKSAILVEDFDTIQDLAAFIKQLDRNDEQYESYLQFKHTGISNPTLKSELARISPGKYAGGSFGKAALGYECFLCDKLHKALDATKAGKPVAKAQANLNHSGCPLPAQKFDENGQIVPDHRRKHKLAFYHMNAQVFRQFYDRAENITSHDLYTATKQRLRKAQAKQEDL